MATNVPIKVLNRPERPPTVRNRRMRDFGCYWDGEGLIEINPRLEPKERFGTLLHECLHHYMPWWSERKVTRTANQMTKLLWPIVKSRK